MTSTVAFFLSPALTYLQPGFLALTKSVQEASKSLNPIKNVVLRSINFLATVNVLPSALAPFSKQAMNYINLVEVSNGAISKYEELKTGCCSDKKWDKFSSFSLSGVAKMADFVVHVVEGRNFLKSELWKSEAAKGNALMASLRFLPPLSGIYQSTKTLLLKGSRSDKLKGTCLSLAMSVSYLGLAVLNGMTVAGRPLPRTAQLTLGLTGIATALGVVSYFWNAESTLSSKKD